MFAGSQSFGGETLIMGASGTGAPELKKPRNEEPQAILAVTVRSIELALANRLEGDDVVRFHGMEPGHGLEPGMLVLVGAAEDVAQQASSLEFTVNDSTGRIFARFFMVDGDNPLAGLAPGRYVALAGQLRTSPRPHISITNARLVRSADEISYHFIEVAYAALKIQRGRAEVATPSPKRPVREAEAAVGVEVTPPKGPPAFGATPAPEPAERFLADAPLQAPKAVEVPKIGSNEGLTGDRLREALVQVLQREAETGGEEGVSVAKLCDQLKPAPSSEIIALLQGLLADGEVYNTVDDDHFAII